MSQPGYISGETLMNYADQQDLCVIATWQSMAEWLKWKENPERKDIAAMLEIFQSGPVVYEEYFLRTPFQKMN
jgi:heme-degrading monooxygenase HmoA